MAKRNSKKKNAPKNVKVISILEFDNGVVVKSSGKGKLKGSHVTVTKQPTLFKNRLATSKTIVKIGERELGCIQTSNGLEIV